MENPIGTMSVETDGVVWQDNYEEVVTYEEAINLDDSFDISNGNGDDDNNTGSYETAVDDDSRYYSIVNETIVGGDENVSGASLGAGDKTVTGDDAEETLVPKGVPEDCKMFENKNVLVNEEVVLYKIEGSNELYAVQFATDESGNLQKYQYQVRATEDGQFEAVPGTIELQPETNDEVNVYKANPETNYKPSIDHANYEVNLQEQYMTTMLHEPNVENEPNCEYVDGGGGEETQIEQMESVDAPSADDTAIRVDGHEMKDLYEEGMYEEYLEDSDESPSQSLPEYTDLKFFDAENTEDGDTFDELGAKIKIGADERFESVDPIIVRKSSGGGTTELHVLSEMLVPKPAKRNSSLNASKQSVPKTDQCTALNKIKANIISIVQDNGIVKKRPPAVTHVLNKVRSNDPFESYDFDIKPVAATARNVVDAKNNKKMTFLIVSRNTSSDVRSKEEIQRTPEMFKNSRSILKPTFRKSVGANYARVEPKVYRDSSTGLVPLKVPSLSAVPNVQNDVVLEKVDRPKPDSSPREPENRVSRQPRKQTIRPVDRVGSEIIIQPSEEDAQIITYDLEVSDGEYTSNKVKARKKKVPKKRGKKPKTLEIVLSDNEDDEETSKCRPDRSRPVEDDSEECREADVRSTGESDCREISTVRDRSDDGVVNGRFVSDAEKAENVDAKSTTDLNNVMENVLSIMEEIHGEQSSNDKQSNDKHRIELRVDVKESENSETDLLSLLENTNSPSVEERSELATRQADKSPENLPLSSRTPEKIPDVVDGARAAKKNNGTAAATTTATKKKAWKCSKCPKSFPNEPTLVTHSQVHRIRKRERWQCDRCPKRFFFERFYDIHVKTHDDGDVTGANESRIPRVDGTRETMTCDVCSKKFTSLSLYDAHMSVHRKRLKPKDPVFSSRSGRSPLQLLRTKSGMVCSTPLKSATSASSQRVDSSRKQFHCDVCSKPFRQMTALMLHREQHKITCATCGKKFRFKHLLDEHVRRHCLNSSAGKKKRNSVSRLSVNHGFRKPKPNINRELHCDVCGREFKTVFMYQTHVKFAHGTPNEMSKMSNRSTFKRSESSAVKNETVKRVIQTDGKKTTLVDPTAKRAKEHRFDVPDLARAVDRTNEVVTERRQSIRKQVPSQKVTALKCTLCDLSFSTHTGLFRHTRTHSENKHKCDYCDIVFETIDLLASHIQSHISGDSLVCTTCGQRFPTKRSFAEHISRTSHKYPVDGRQTTSKVSKRNIGHGGVPLSAKIQSFLVKRQKL